MKNLIADIRENSITHGSLPFWSWNDKLDEKTLRRQINDMKRLGMNGFFMHARCGLETKYLSKQWFDAVKACVDEAKKLGMEAWSYDENGWPSGFAGGKLLKTPDNYSMYLEHEFVDTFPTETKGIYAIYAIKGTTHPKRVHKPCKNAEKYLLVYLRENSAYVDVMREDITEKFIKETHQVYKDKLGDDFGKAMPGFFTDEPQYYRALTPYSRYMDKWFKEEYGYSVFKALPAIFMEFEGCESYLYDFHKMTHTKYINGFIKPIYEWSQANGVKVTGHSVDEIGLAEQMKCCGDVMPFYEYEDMPGIDYLTRELPNQLAPKQLGSVCEQLGKKKALTETFGCCGWDITPTELKTLSEIQYAGGVNVMCQHLYPISERGQRKRDYPAHYSEHNAWQDKLKDFNTYFNNLGYTLSLGKQDANILVIHPMHTAWLTYRRHVHAHKIEPLESDFIDLFTKLSQYQLPYHFGNETLMAKYGEVIGDKLRVGECVYDTVIIPKCDTLDDITVALLRKFKDNGGKLYFSASRIPKRIDGKTVTDGRLDFLKSAKNIECDEVFAELADRTEYSLRLNGENLSDVLCMTRVTKEYGNIYYFTNTSKKKLVDAVLTIKGKKKLSSLDMLTLKKSPVRGRFNGDYTEILLTFDENASFVLIEDNCDYLPFEATASTEFIKLRGKYKIAKRTENILILDRVNISFDGVNFTEQRPIEQVRDNLIYDKYNGDLWLKFSFNTEFLPKKIDFVCEKPGVLDISVNGTPVKMGKRTWFDMYFKRTNVAPYLHTGVNEVTLHYNYHQKDEVHGIIFGNVMESLRNCLNFDTELEACYLVGDFAVMTEEDKFVAATNGVEHYLGGFSLAPQKKTVSAKNLVHEGYPFFSGSIELEKTVNYKLGAPTVIRLNGRYAVCDVFVNDCHAGTMLFTNYLDLKPYLKEGKNKIRLVLCTNRRNTLGPHHTKVDEPMFVQPKSFTFEGSWRGDKCEQFKPDYSFVRFGIN